MRRQLPFRECCCCCHLQRLLRQSCWYCYYGIVWSATACHCCFHWAVIVVLLILLFRPSPVVLALRDVLVAVTQSVKEWNPRREAVRLIGDAAVPFWSCRRLQSYQCYCYSRQREWFPWRPKLECSCCYCCFLKSKEMKQERKK